MVHGIFPITSLESVAQNLRSAGYLCTAPALSPLHNTASRSQTLKREIERVLEEGYKKVHLVGHSGGGLDAKALLDDHKQRSAIRSITTLSTPHKGSVLFSSLIIRFLALLLKPWIQIFCRSLIKRQADIELNLPACLKNLACGRDIMKTSSKGNDIFLQSYAAQFPKIPPKSYRALGPQVLNWIIEYFEGPNDGVISVDSSKWQNFRGVLDASHFSLVGNKLISSESFDAPQFFLNLARELTDLEASPKNS